MPSLPVVMISSSEDQDLPARVISSGADIFIPKFRDHTTLMRALKVASVQANQSRRMKLFEISQTVSDELYLTSFAASRLRMELDRVPLWRGESVSIKQLAEDFARYLYLPRLKDSSVLVSAARDGLLIDDFR